MKPESFSLGGVLMSPPRFVNLSIGSRHLSSARPKRQVVLLVALLGCLGGVKAQPLIMSRRGLGVITLCARLATVNRAFRRVTDTLVEGEDSSRWPAKLVKLGDGRLAFEASWSDSVRIWRITATSSAVRTMKGYHIGTTFHELSAAGESMTLSLPEGGLVIVLESEGVAVTFDEHSELDFYQRYTDFHAPPRLDMISPEARVRTLFTSGSCPQGSH